MASKPTLRKNGKMMYTLAIKAHVDVHDIIRAMVWSRWHGNQIPTSREKAIKLTRDFVRQHGWDNWSRVDGETMEEYGQACALKTQELFPDMCRGVDLSDYNVTRVTEESSLDPAPYCSYGHRTQKDCNCGPIADNE